MRQDIFLIVISSIILINVAHVMAECNVCSVKNQLACVSETTYQFCVNNTPSGAINTCPSGYVCSTASNIICVPNAVDVAATCRECKQCDPNLVFACTSANTYALCLGQTTPSKTLTGTCGASHVCNVNSPQICANSTTFAATCPTDVNTTNNGTTTSATSTFRDIAQHFCSIIRIYKLFKVPKKLDNSCKRYISCFRTLSGTWTGKIYTCGSSSYFDPVTRYCVNFKPANC